jgi:hypothetical protein
VDLLLDMALHPKPPRTHLIKMECPVIARESVRPGTPARQIPPARAAYWPVVRRPPTAITINAVTTGAIAIGTRAIAKLPVLSRSTPIT